MNKIIFISVLAFWLTSSRAQQKIQATTDKPNVIFILADDQGYGDFGINGNPWIKTPEMDRLAREGIYLTNFHTESTCSPTRAGLMTGNYANKTGVWHTINGRELLSKDFPTIAEFFKKSGYRTGLFGKWHLGDYEGYRPEHRGFDETLIMQGGGVGQIADYWNNDYFGDTYFRNGKPEKFSKYCTEVWFDNAIQFIEKSKADRKPFICFIPTNAAHFPFYVPQSYIDPYKNIQGVPNAAFYGMITGIDDQLGRLRGFLDKAGLADNTIIIYTCDNGTSEGVVGGKNAGAAKGYSAGWKGKKASEYEGGHRLPMFMYWKNGKLTGGKKIDELCAYVDIMPTLLELCGAKVPDNLDGISLKPLLYGKSWQPDRMIVSNTQRTEFLQKWKNTSIMQGNWRLITSGSKRELHDLTTDTGQAKNLAANYPERVKEMENFYEKWWALTSVSAEKYNRIPIGDSVTLTADDCHETEGAVAWTQIMVREGTGAKNGFWALEAASAGNYEISVGRYPRESGLTMGASAPEGEKVTGSTPWYPAGKKMNFVEAEISVNGAVAKVPVSANAKEVSVKMPIAAGPVTLKVQLTDAAGTSLDAYYVYVKKLK